jgi:hypothetical protein
VNIVGGCCGTTPEHIGAIPGVFEAGGLTGAGAPTGKQSVMAKFFFNKRGYAFFYERFLSDFFNKRLKWDALLKNRPMNDSHRAGRWVQQLTGYKAFIPAPLPPDPPLIYSGAAADQPV